MGRRKKIKKVRLLAVVCMTVVVNFASADTIRGINIDFVTIGHAGNTGEQSRLMAGDTTYYGAVSYNYRIGKYEVTNAQWNAFTAAAGVPTGNPGEAYDASAYWTGAQQPTNRVSWFEAAQFCNYLTSGDKSKGAYQFSGNNSNPGYVWGINRDAAISSYGIAYVIPTQDEWYKAAYYKPDGSGYSLYANGTNTAPSTSESRYGQVVPDRGPGPWDVGTGTMEQNGTFDMMGNVFEWTETLIVPGYYETRGGSYYGDSGLISSNPGSYEMSGETINLGLRVASVPEPASAAIMTLAGLLIALKRKQR